MRVFFGKISTKVNVKQFEEGFYETDKPSMFNGIEIGCYTFIVANGKIQLWKAKEWKNDGRRLEFEILIADTGMNTKDLCALKYFKINTHLLVLSVRSSTNAFFEIQISKAISENELLNIETYRNQDNFRNIIVLESLNSCVEDSEDVQLYYEDGKLNIYTSKFIDNETFSKWHDNIDKIGKGQKNKDKALNQIKSIKNFPKTINRYSVSLLNLYDAFGVSYNESVEEVDSLEENSSNDDYYNSHYANPVNQILFGPPGTGKTYHTIEYALRIICPEYYEKYKNDRAKLKTKFDELLVKEEEGSGGRIAFCTFHQSFSYEDFMEGIKPNFDEESANVEYRIQKGVFKRMCELASSYVPEGADSPIVTKAKLISDEEFAAKDFYKLSLGNTSISAEAEIFQYCIENNCICVGFADWLDFTGKEVKEIYQLCHEQGLSSYSAQVLSYFMHYLKIGDYVVISNGNYKARAIGKVTGQYEYKPGNKFSYPHFRSVEWLSAGVEFNVSDLYERNFSQQTIYQLNKAYLKEAFFTGEEVEIEERKEQDELLFTDGFVLIIDEINRGNVSQIFGELITLIEEDKRLGKNESLEVVLPYSKDNFGVPPNLYIIGTMNTADRSVEALDTALRRRFSFVEMPPMYGLNELSYEVTPNITASNLLKTINNRIEKLLGKDHLIGHSYLMKSEGREVDLLGAFYNKIIPLLQEYFYGDYGKIGLVLGKGFIKDKFEKKDDIFCPFGDYQFQDFEDKHVYEIIDYRKTEVVDGMNFLQAIEYLINPKIKPVEQA